MNKQLASGLSVIVLSQHTNAALVVVTAGMHTVHFLLLLKILKSPTWTGPGAKLSYRSAIHGKVRLFAGSVWSWPQGQAEVGRDQEHPGNTSHGPNKLKFGQTYYF